jgi:hypothetical protein
MLISRNAIDPAQIQAGMRVNGNIRDRYTVFDNAKPFMYYGSANCWNVALYKRHDFIEPMDRFRFEEIIPNSVTHV